MARKTNGFQYIRVQSIPSFGFRLHIITNLQKKLLFIYCSFKKEYAQSFEKTSENSVSQT